jgi:hypothetical protein
MKKLLFTSLGVIFCAASAYAAAPPGQTERALKFSLSPAAQSHTSFMVEEERPAAPALEMGSRLSRSTAESIAEIAYKISYVGSFILTADRLVRSVDSVLDHMSVTQDETTLRLDMRPASKGFQVMLKLDRHLDF